MTTLLDGPSAPRVDLAARLGPVVHGIAPGQCIGGPRVVNTLLVLFGPQLKRELDARAAPPANPPQRPRR